MSDSGDGRRAAVALGRLAGRHPVVVVLVALVVLFGFVSSLVALVLVLSGALEPGAAASAGR